MEISGFYKVTVKIEEEKEDSKGNIKRKKTKESYIVENCGDPQAAVDVVEREFKDFTFEWAIESVKEEKINGILKK